MTQDRPPGPPDAEVLGDRMGQAVGRVAGIVGGTLISLVFVGLWVFMAAAAFGDGTLPADAWAWLTGLDTIASVVAWLAILPIAVFLWAWQADLAPWAMGIAMIGFVAWTAVAFSGPLRALARRLEGQAA